MIVINDDEVIEFVLWKPTLVPKRVIKMDLIGKNKNGRDKLYKACYLYYALKEQKLLEDLGFLETLTKLKEMIIKINGEGK